METILFSNARQQLARLLDRISGDKAPVEIVRRDKPSVVVMDKAEYEGLMETMHLLSSPRNAARLAQGIAEFERGDTIEFDPPAQLAE